MCAKSGLRCTSMACLKSSVIVPDVCFFLRKQSKALETRKSACKCCSFPIVLCAAAVKVTGGCVVDHSYIWYIECIVPYLTHCLTVGHFSLSCVYSPWIFRNRSNTYATAIICAFLDDLVNSMTGIIIIILSATCMASSRVLAKRNLLDRQIKYWE